VKNIVEFKNIFKSFQFNVVRGVKDLIVGKRIDKKFGKYNRQYALNGLSFEIQPGDSLGIIGHNGSGKSTTLGLLANLMDPDNGTINIFAKRVVSLLELNSGIEPELTGLENIFLYGSIISIPYYELKKNLNNIIDFSELGGAIHNQVKSYSSGMKARLAFSILQSAEPELLLIDEVYAVGDRKFKEKCQKYMDDFKKCGGTIIYVTHEISSLKNLCNKTLILENGKSIFFGNTLDAIRIYEKS
jgi:ABC-type polysaccharide/polyol phosphate transport system ATPase subunit